LAEGVDRVAEGTRIAGGADGFLVELGFEDVAGGFPGVGDGVGGAGDGGDEAGVGGVAVGEGVCGVGDGFEAAGGGVIAVSDLVLDGAAVFELPAGVATEAGGFAVEGTGEIPVAVVVEIITNDFLIRLKGGWVVGGFNPGLIGLGDDGLASERIVGDGDVRRAVAVIGGGQQAMGVAVGGGDAALPVAGFEPAGVRIGVVGAIAIGVLLAIKAAGGGGVFPLGFGGACGWRGGGFGEDGSGLPNVEFDDLGLL